MNTAKEKPLTGLFFGLLVGLAIAVLLQQGGVWPLDKLTVFLLPALVALTFILIARVGRTTTPAALTVALILLIAPVAWGLTGIGEINENGVLNGGCTVEAASDLDTTIVTDTSRSDPFKVDPDGGLSWIASSPGPITDHQWDIYVNVGGFEFVVADGGDPNDDLDVDNLGNEPTVSGYVADLGFRSGEEIRGIYEVGGFIAGAGGACDGFGFVEVTGGVLDTLISKIALAVLLLALTIFLIVLFTSRRNQIEADGVVDPDAGLASVGAGTGAAGVAAASAHDDGDDAVTNDGASDDLEDGEEEHDGF